MAEHETQPETPTPQAPPSERRTDETVKETFESIIIAFILAFVFRAYVVEAFVIPTGSMAPTLLGAHVAVTCEQCGYEFDTGVDRQIAAAGYAPHPLTAACPMCWYPNVIAPGTRVRFGDRILVQKYVYTFSEPRRWDVVVFKAPHQPDTNYIKRLVGKPNEKLVIFDGNVYVQPLDPDTGEPTGEWRIARKTDRPEVQRAVWQPVYHSEFIPLDEGDPARSRRQVPWDIPWQVEQGDDWRIEHRRSYVHASDEPGRIGFEFPAEPPWRLERDRGEQPASLYPYNQVGQSWNRLEPVEDVRVAAVVQPEAEGLRVALSTTTRLNRDEPLPLTAHLGGGELRLTVTGPDGQEQEVAAAVTRPGGVTFEPGENTAVELWYVDQEASVWVDGERVLRARFEMPMQAVYNRPAPPLRPEIDIAVEGAPVTLHRVQVDRDLYYSALNAQTSWAERGVRWRNRQGQIEGEPVVLGPDELFCLGDNSPVSEDGRYWTDVDAWVGERMFAGEPQAGIVPEELLMGRAFYVYFPGPLPWKDEGFPVAPNFGDMRFIH